MCPCKPWFISERWTKNDIKAHYNAGGLPEYMNFELVKPLWILFKYELCIVGEELIFLNGIPFAIHRTKSRKWIIHPSFIYDNAKKAFKFTTE